MGKPELYPPTTHIKPKGYDKDILKDCHEDFLCTECKYIMINPSQIPCGHRFCKSCIDYLNECNKPCITCVENNEEFMGYDITPDFVIIKELKHKQATCPKCKIVCLFKDFGNHLTVCNSKDNIYTESYINEVIDQIFELHKLHEKDTTTLKHTLKTQVSTVNSVEKLMDEVKNKLQCLEEENKSLKTLCAKLNTSIKEKNATVAELSIKLSNMEFGSYDGTFTFKIVNVLKGREEAITNGKIILSVPFYTSREMGYKMCMGVYLNGYNNSVGTHASVGVTVMKGYYDDMLRWPLDAKITLIWFDQKNTKSTSVTFSTNQYENNFMKPKDNMNKIMVCSEFLSLEHINNTKFGYVKDNVAFVKVIVEVKSEA